MSTREDILYAVRRNRPPGEHPLPAINRFPGIADPERIQTFLRNLELMGGRGLPEGPLPQLLQEYYPEARVIASAIPEVTGTIDLASVTSPHALADVDLAIVRAQFGVAETGSVLLTDSALAVNALGYLAQHLLVLLDPDEILPGLQEAYERAEFHQHAYASLHTGPSATADIEGVLIHGAQGVRSLSVVLHPRQTG